LKDIRPLLLVLLSAGLIGTWIYHLYDKTMYTKRRHEIYIKDSAAVAEGVRDSLHKIYSVTISNLDSRLNITKTNADSLKYQLDSKLGEIYKLRNEISTILKNKGATRADMDNARRMIGELQEKVDELRNENTSMEEEKKRLNEILEQLSTDMKSLEQNVKRLDEENKTLTEKVNLASIFVASEMKLIPIALRNSKEQETTSSRKANKLVVSFTVQNNIGDNNAAEVFIIVTQPDGQVLRNSVWDSGTFDTRNEGKKSHTLRMKFEYNKGEPKPLLFTLNPESFQTGNYTLQVYHRGVKIGEVVKSLS
jgi:hypothetical protein